MNRLRYFRRSGHIYVPCCNLGKIYLQLYKISPLLCHREYHVWIKFISLGI